MGSGLCVRVGMVGDVVDDMLKKIDAKGEMKVGGVWMVEEEGVEEKQEENQVKKACRDGDVEFKIWTDEKYLIDE